MIKRGEALFKMEGEIKFAKKIREERGKER